MMDRNILHHICEHVSTSFNNGRPILIEADKSIDQAKYRMEMAYIYQDFKLHSWDASYKKTVRFIILFTWENSFRFEFQLYVY